MFATAIRCFAKKPKPKMKPIELKTPPEQTNMMTRVIFDVVREHGPLTVSETWDHVKGTNVKNFLSEAISKETLPPKKKPWRQTVGLRGLTGKQHMKILLRWMKERGKLRLICNHDGAQKQFLYTIWFTNPRLVSTRPRRDSSVR
ncbi:hypothetical protein QJS04_geneDACA006337 [Acorus gramineus]|uniref:Uncharacterized protein n=1 Tax=Acorus gramineus TaxID=55184 RepID=A0AAV9AVY3_ACOGR|nr:hypothetical protein QJS04_geneDACA006337 [Acorus gramineus]